MKKKLIMLALCISIGALAAGCSNKKSDGVSGSSTSSTASSSADTADSSSQSADDDIPIVDKDLDVTECVTLGDYKGITLEKKIQQVTEEDIDNSISQALMTTVTDPDAAVQEGDTVDIAYVGKIDGKEFDGGSSDSYSLSIGSDTFIDGFEDGIIGMKQDETKDLNLKFPDDYPSSDVAGKDVVFTVTVNAISRPQELTDAWVQENTDYSTVDEYRQSQKEQLEASNEFSAENTLKSSVLETVCSNATISQIPQSYITLGEEIHSQMYSSYAAMYGISLDEFLDQYVDKDQFEQEKAAVSRQVAEVALVIDAIVKNEGWTTEDEDYVSLLNTAVESSGLSQEEYLKQNGEQYVELSINQDRVINFVLDNATVNDVMVDADGNPV